MVARRGQIFYTYLATLRQFTRFHANNSMTFYARSVLDDCRYSLSLLEEEKDIRKWRITWVAAVALNQLFGRWKEDRESNLIFHEFIEKERNNILKEYEVNIHPMDEVPVVIELSLQSLETGEMKRDGFILELGENIYRPILGGEWDGDDAREVYTEAIDWWDAQLKMIEKIVSASKK